MKFNIEKPVEGIENIRVEYSFWTGKVLMWIDDASIDIKKGKKKINEITSPAGSTHKISVYSAGFDYIPIVNLDGKEIRLARKLTVYEWILSALPLIMIAFGGALGGAIGACGLFVNIAVFRSKLSRVARICISLAFSASSVGIFYLLARIIARAIS